MTLNIGMVGGGASSVCLLDALAQMADLPAGGITVFEPSQHFWRGRAYQPDMETVQVNAPPDDMSVRGGDSGHFEEWLVARDLVLGTRGSHVDAFSNTRFVPRAVYGDYLEQSARAALMTLVRRGWQVNLVRERVESASPVRNGVVLRTEQGDCHTVDRAVLCVGGGQPTDHYSLAGLPNYIADPYPASGALTAIDPDDEVAVLGSGLTAVDVVLALARRDHRGPIRLLSRRGVLPGVRQCPVRYDLRHFTPELFRSAAAAGRTFRLAEVVAIMKEELNSAGECPQSVLTEIYAVGREDPVRRLRRQLGEVDSPSLGLRILQRAVPDVGPDVWPLLSENDKDQLLATHYRTLMSLCCPMPPASAAKLLGLIDSGQVEIVSGLRDVTPAHGGGFVATAGDRSDTYQVVINAVSPPAHKVPKGAAGLVGSLLSAGVAERHPRAGVHVERATSRLTVASAPDPRLYALGDLASGTLFFTFGIQSLVDRAVDIARAICAELAVCASSPAQTGDGAYQYA